MFFPLDLSLSSSAFSPAGTQPVSSCCCLIPVVPSLLFGANLHSDFTDNSKWLICRQRFSSKAYCDLFSSGVDVQSEVPPGHVSQEK